MTNVNHEKIINDIENDKIDVHEDLNKYLMPEDGSKLHDDSGNIIGRILRKYDGGKKKIEARNHAPIDIISNIQPELTNDISHLYDNRS